VPLWALRIGVLTGNLTRFTCDIETIGYVATTNISPLFSCVRVLCDTLAGYEPSPADAIRKSALSVFEAARSTPWRPMQPVDELCSDLVLLRSWRSEVCQGEPDTIRHAFRQSGVSLSNCDRGMRRLSMPEGPLAAKVLSLLRSSLQSVS